MDLQKANTPFVIALAMSIDLQIFNPKSLIMSSITQKCQLGLRQILVLVFMFGLSATNYVDASSHREAPLIANDPLADNVDVYAFRSPDNPDMITLIATYIPLQLPQGGPNYYQFGENIRYEIHVDNDASIPGDEVTYRFTFTQENEDPTTFFNIRLGAQNLKTTYTLERSMDGGSTWQAIITDGIVPPNNIGPRSIESAVGLNTTYEALFTGAITDASTGERVFAGPTDDPFFVDLGGIFDLGDAPRQDGPPRDGVACYNVSALAIQVPIATLLKAGAPAEPTSILDPDYVIGVWASASRPAITTLGADGPSYSGEWVQVSRLGMPLTNEAVIPIGDKDEWNRLTPYNENPEHFEYFYNPELALYMDDDLFGGAVPAFAPLRIQTASLGAFDFTNGADGLFGLKGTDAVAGTALDDAIFGTLLLPDAGKPRSVDLWPAFHTGVPNFPPYQLATGKEGNPLAAGKPFVNNFLPNGGDMLRLNMAVPPTPRDDPNFSHLGLIQAAAIGLTVAPFNETADLEFIPNMDGFPNGRRLEDDVTLIELQAVSGVVLAAIGLWYDDFDPATSESPVTEDLLNVLTFATGVEANDKPFRPGFPYLATPFSGAGECGGIIPVIEDPEPQNGADLSLMASVDDNIYEQFTNVKYTITVTNHGPEATSNVSVSAGIPEGLVFTSDNESQGEYNLFFQRWDVGMLESGASATLELTLFVLVDGVDITNFFQVLSSATADPDSTPGNDNDQTPDEDDEAAVTISPVVSFLQDASENGTIENTSKSSIEPASLNAEPILYPNPAVDQITLEFELRETQVNQIRVFNVRGQLVKEIAFEAVEGFNQVQIDTKSIAVGMYYIQLPGANGMPVVVSFVKETMN